MNIKCTLMLISTLTTTQVFAAPAINVGALNEFIAGGKNTLAKRIHNHGDSTAFVRVTVAEMVFDRDGEITEQPLDAEAIVNGRGTGLLSTPPRLIIPAGVMQTNRLVFTGSRERERYYRVRYIPVVPENKEEFGLATKELNDYRDKINAGVTVLSGFGTILTVQPNNVQFSSKIEGAGPQLKITNNGNSSIIIDDLKACSVKTKLCGNGSSTQLRPGRQLLRTAQPDQIWQYTLVEGSQKSALNTGK